MIRTSIFISLLLLFLGIFLYTAPATLIIVSQPVEARVLLNQEFVGQTPLTLSLKPGTYEVKVEHSGHEVFTQRITLSSRENKTITARLTPSTTKGSIRLFVTPPAHSVLLNGQRVDGGFFTVDPGVHRLRISREGFHSADMEVLVSPGQLIYLNYELLPLLPLEQEPIQGPSLLTAKQMAAYVEDHLRARGQKAKINAESVLQLAEYYIQWGNVLGIRGDVAFAQSLHETGYFQFGGSVLPEQNNYGGIGSTGSGVRGAYFESPEIGVLAQIQHLFAYATSSERQLPPGMQIHTPRWHLIQRGSATTWRDLTGRYAMDPQYHLKVWNHYTLMRRHAGH